MTVNIQAGDGSPEGQRAKIIRFLAVETGADARTASRWIDGGPVSPAIDYALRAASERLGFASEAIALREQNLNKSAAFKDG